MRMLLPLGFLLLVLALGPSCGEEVVGPLAPDSTSQDFTFDIAYISADVSSVLYDVCYINDTCIWAVGWIVKREGSPDATNYNAVRWDGKTWHLQQIPGVESDGITIDHDVLYTVYGDTPDNIWFSTGARFIHWNGEEFSTVYHLAKEITGRILECWASGPDNIWMGGMNGELVHFNGRIWKRIKNDIEYEITGIWGNGDTVLVAALERPVFTRTKFYIVVDEKVHPLMYDTSVVQVNALWYEHLNHIYAEGPWLYNYNGKSWDTVRYSFGLATGRGTDMYGNNRNDIAVCGHYGTIRHWNGKRWMNWWRQPGLENALFFGITMHDNRLWAVGSNGTGKKAVIVTGTRPG
jgi:hypothetical protein